MRRSNLLLKVFFVATFFSCIVTDVAFSKEVTVLLLHNSRQETVGTAAVLTNVLAGMGELNQRLQDGGRDIRLEVVPFDTVIPVDCGDTLFDRQIEKAGQLAEVVLACKDGGKEVILLPFGHCADVARIATQMFTSALLKRKEGRANESTFVPIPQDFYRRIRSRALGLKTNVSRGLKVGEVVTLEMDEDDVGMAHVVAPGQQQVKSVVTIKGSVDANLPGGKEFFEVGEGSSAVHVNSDDAIQRAAEEEEARPKTCCERFCGCCMRCFKKINENPIYKFIAQMAIKEALSLAVDESGADDFIGDIIGVIF
jgi:hypothetical protein